MNKKLSAIILLSYAASTSAGGWYRYEPSGAEWGIFFGIAALGAFADTIAAGMEKAYEGVQKLIHPVQGPKSYLCIKGNLKDLGYRAGKMFGSHLEAESFKDRAVGFVAQPEVVHGRHAAWICKRMAGLPDNEVVSVIRREDHKLSYIGKGEKPDLETAEAFARSTIKSDPQMKLKNRAEQELAVLATVSNLR